MRYTDESFVNRFYYEREALWSGFRHARYNVVMTLDADLQNDPTDTPHLMKK